MINLDLHSSQPRQLTRASDKHRVEDSGWHDEIDDAGSKNIAPPARPETPKLAHHPADSRL